MKTVLIDAFDSFVFIIEQYLRELGSDAVVLRSHPDNAKRINDLEPDALVLGPGPGHPIDAGHVELVEEFAGRIPMLGVCLGHQAIGVAYGATVRPATHLMHGKTSRIEHDGRGVFARADVNALVTRYHSLIVDDSTVPEELEVTARSLDDGYIMGMRHRRFAVESVQFHPESITTIGGSNMFRSFFDAHVPGWVGQV